MKDKDIKLMIDKAYYLESIGLLRRAMYVWREIAVDVSVDETKRNMAWKRLLCISEMVYKKSQEEREQLKNNSGRVVNVEIDRQKIIQYLKNGMSASQIEALTQRSKAFIYSCKKYL